MIRIASQSYERHAFSSLFDLENAVELSFEYRGTGDIYILGHAYENGKANAKKPEFTFVITKEQPEIYELFDQAYIDITHKGDFTDREMGLQYDKESQQLIISSEDDRIDTCNEFIMKKLTDGYEIIIINKDYEEYYTQVCFVGSGSRQYNISLYGTFLRFMREFMKMKHLKIDEHACRDFMAEKSRQMIKSK